MGEEYQKKIELFREYYLFTREDIVKSVNLLIDHIANDKEYKASPVTKEKRINLLKSFAEIVSKSHLPVLTDLWWFYDYSFTGGHLNLFLAEASEIEFEDNSPSSMTYSNEDSLIRVESEYLSIEQFAELHSVRVATVQQWINIGKLKNARLINNEWLIPETEDRPHNQISGMQYYFENESGIQSYEFPFLSSAESVYFETDKDSKDMFICHFDNFGKKMFHKIKLSKDDVERLEFTIISSGKAMIEEGARLTPYIRE